MIVFGSRGSDLAMTQTRAVAEQVKQTTGVDYRIEVLVTTGDRIQDKPLRASASRASSPANLKMRYGTDLSTLRMHSLKDLPVQDPEGITLVPFHHEKTLLTYSSRAKTRYRQALMRAP